MPEDSADLDVQDFGCPREQNLPRKATEDRSRAWKQIATTPFVGLTSIVVLVLKAGGRSSPKGLPVVAAVNGSTTGQISSGETTAASGDDASSARKACSR